MKLVKETKLEGPSSVTTMVLFTSVRSFIGCSIIHWSEMADRCGLSNNFPRQHIFSQTSQWMAVGVAPRHHILAFNPKACWTWCLLAIGPAITRRLLLSTIFMSGDIGMSGSVSVLNYLRHIWISFMRSYIKPKRMYSYLLSIDTFHCAHFPPSAEMLLYRPFQTGKCYVFPLM